MRREQESLLNFQSQLYSGQWVEYLGIVDKSVNGIFG